MCFIRELHDSLGADVYAHVHRLVSVVKMVTVLDECNTEEHCSVVRIFFLVKRTQCFLFTVKVFVV
jgi:hypothetical protein